MRLCVDIPIDVYAFAFHCVDAAEFRMELYSKLL
jgi:hypothetical protein